MAVPIPNFGALADEQKTADDYAVNQTNQANRPNQYNPYGSLTWAQGPDGSWTQNTTLSAPAQGLFDQSMTAQGSLTDRLGAGAPEASFGAQQNVIDAWNRLQQPDLDRQAGARRARAAAMGLTTGSMANTSIEDDITNAYRTAGDTSIIKGVDAWNQLYDRQLQGYNANRGALGDITKAREGLNPNAWAAKVPASQTYTPESVYGSAMDTYSAGRQEENADITERNAEIQGYVNLLTALGGIKDAPTNISNAANSFLNTAGNVWNRVSGGLRDAWNFGSEAYDDIFGGT